MFAVGYDRFQAVAIVEILMEKRDYFGITLNIFSTLATFAICVLLITDCYGLSLFEYGISRLRHAPHDRTRNNYN